ncbi:hypothetical protein INT45_007707 [Circinella minor]|uniref:Nuclear pore complex protein Nup85 n=1 Tax=Circinella minor TaxID=1195481 RepID=A0A8H7RQT1_9FUNG|nr:hypothetical protein INT45_007707 [Circinella minor]
MFIESAKLFRKIHEQQQQQSSKTRSQSELATISSSYRKLLSDFLLPPTNEKSFTEVFEKHGTVTLLKQTHYRQLLALWDLCDILYFTDGDKRMTGLKLLQWLNKNDKGIHRFDLQGIMNNSRGPIDHPDFWPCIYKLIFRREFKTLIDFIKIAKNKQFTSKEASQLLDHLLRVIIDVPSIPRTTTATTLKNDQQDTIDKYISDWSKWREKVYKTAESLQKGGDRSILMHQKSLLNALAILHGQQKTILNQADHPTEAIICFILNNHPFATPHEIRTIITNELDISLKHQQDDNERFYAFGMMIKGNIAEALDCFRPDDWWTLVHLVDLFGLSTENLACNYISTIGIQLFDQEDVQQQLYSMEFRTFLILTYVRLLGQQSSLWKYGLDYIKTCGDLGKKALMNYIQCIPTNNSIGVQELLELCIEKDYVKEVVEIYKHEADKGIKDSYSKAIRYLYDIGNYSYLEDICELGIYQFASTGNNANLNHC